MTLQLERFDEARSVVLAHFRLQDREIFKNDDAPLPLEQVEDGWLCLSRDGDIRLLLNNGSETKFDSLISTLAHVGSLVSRIPSVAYLIERPHDAAKCARCGGLGVPPGIPEELQQVVRCDCGGLGWVALPVETK